MIVVGGHGVAIIALVLALWLVAAISATLFGMMRARRAHAAIAEAGRLKELLQGAPAIALLVTEDDRIEADPRLADWLGIPRLPRFLAALDTGGASGLSAEDAAGIARDIAATRRSGRAFARTIHPVGSNRVILVQGRLSATPGRVVLWWFDATDTRAEMARLGAETERLGKAIDGLSGLIEAAPFPMWYRGPDLRLALVNSAYVRAVEAPNAADVVARGLELVEAHDGKGPLSASAAASDEGRIATRTVPATIAGARRMIRIVDVPLGNGGIAGYAIDVEELEQARADLGRFARAQRDMLDLLSAGVAQFAADRTLVFSNQPFQRLFAMKPEWLADRPEFDRVLERMREANRLPDSRDFPGWKAERRQWFLAGEDPSEDHWLLPDGVHLRVLAQPLPDGGLLLIFEDRTEQVQLASARDTLLRVRAATFDNLFEAVGVFASDGRLHLWNNRFREAWGLSEEDLARHPRVDRLVEAVSARLTNPRHAGLIRELVRIATVERRQRSGRVALTDGRSFEFAVVPLPDGNALFAMLDVTDSRRIERALRDRNEALEEADKLKDAFVASMSYELRTPLTSISGFAEMLRDGYAGALEPVATDYVSAILASVETLRTLIDSVLDLTQVEAGSLPIADEPVDLAALVTSAAAAFEPVARERMIDFDVDVAADTGVARGDSRRLRQALDHVLRNALTYTPSGGRVLLRAAGDGAIARIVVSDNGEGIPAELRDKVFLRFHRTARNAEPRSVGIGLPLTRQFIEAHGGTVELASEPGEGTTIIIDLPRER